MIHFTSDTHFLHDNIIKYSNRPFADLDEMTSVLIERWNSSVRKSDVVYHLGDFAITYGKKHAIVIDSILSCLNGTKFLITGNHDRREVTDNSRWAKVVPYHEIQVELGKARQAIVLCHYSLRSWRGMHRGSWNLFGHSHGSLQGVTGKSIDVGVDCHDYRPISLPEVVEIMRDKPIHTVDHHVPEE